MSIIKEEEFDYQAYTRDNPPDLSKIRRGTEYRRQRFEAARMKRTIRIDEDILEEFRQLTPQGQQYEQIINQALREWLTVKSMKEIVREELRQVIQKTLSSADLVKQSGQSKNKSSI